MLHLQIALYRLSVVLELVWIMQSSTVEVWGSSSGKFLMKRCFQKENSPGAASTAYLFRLVAILEGSHIMHRVKARVKHGVSVTGVRTGTLFPSRHLNFLQHDLCCLSRVCVLTPCPPQNLPEKKWIDSSTLRSSRCCGSKGSAVHSSVPRSLVSVTEREQRYFAVFMILAHTVSDWRAFWSNLSHIGIRRNRRKCRTRCPIRQLLY